MPTKDLNSPPEHAAAPKRRRAPKGEMRRAALLDAATEVFARDGYLAASMRDVAEIAGITTVGLLHHFPNKTALLQAFLERRSKRVVERLADMVNQPTLDGYLRFLRMAMAMSVEDEQECRASVMLNTESLPQGHPAWQWYRDSFKATHQHAQAHLASLVAQGEIREGIEVKALVQEIFSVMDGLQIQWLKGPKEVKVMAVFDHYLQRLERDLRPVSG